MSDQPVRFAYVGCGYVAQSIHIPNFKSLPNCDFVALAEVRQDLARIVAKRYGIPKVYKTHEDICTDPDIEAVGVSAHWMVQGAIAEDLLRAGKNVFMEKPMAVSIKRAEAILAAEKAGGARLMVGYMKRYDPGNLRLKSYADTWRAEGKCGRILLARNHGFGGNWTYANDPNIPLDWSKEPAPSVANDLPEWVPERWGDAYLGYLQQWTHNINLLRFFLGDTDGKAKLVTALLDDDGMTGLTVLDINGTRAVVESGYTQFHAWEEQTQIYFEGGWLKTQAPELMHKSTSATVEVYRAAHDGEPARLSQEYVEPAWAYREEAKHFLERVRSGEPFFSSGQDTLHDVKLLEEIYQGFVNSRK